MRISVIIISYNGQDFIDECIATVKLSLDKKSSEIIVIDNGSEDQTFEIIDAKHADILLTKNHNNLGFARAVNQGIEKSQGEYVFLLNQDTRIRDNAIMKLADRMEQDKSIGTIGPRMVGFDNKLQYSCRAFPWYRHLFYDLTGLAFLFKKSRTFGSWRMGWFDHDTEMEIDQPMGAALMIRREVIKKIGIFDEQFRIFFNDVDYCRRAKENGWKNLFYPLATIEHYYGGTISKMKPAMILESHRAMILYLKKYSRNPIDKLLLTGWRPLLMISAYIRAAIAEMRK